MREGERKMRVEVVWGGVKVWVGGGVMCYLKEGGEVDFGIN